MATGCSKRLNQSVLEDWVGGQRRKVEDNIVPVGSNQTGDVGRGSQMTQYREGSNLPGSAE